MNAVAIPAAITVAVRPTAPVFIFTNADDDADFTMSMDFLTGIVRNGTENSKPTWKCVQIK